MSCVLMVEWHLGTGYDMTALAEEAEHESEKFMVEG